MHADRLICQSNANFMYQKLCCLGFVINEEKSCLVPCQRTKFFGFILDSVLFMVFLPPEKVEKIEKMALYLLDSKQIMIKELAFFIGLLINAFYAVLEAPLHYRTLERQKIKSLEVANNFERKIVLSSVSKDEITWWLKNVKGKNGKKIRPDVVSHWNQTDASNLGYGGFFVEKSVSYGGRWTAHESKHHINYLELLAMFKVLKVWFSGCKDIHIGIQSDSMVAISYIQRMGGIASLDLDMLACDIWNWCIQRNIFISAYFLPGSENLEADFFSDTTEFRLKRDIFLRLSDQLLQTNIDMFASQQNAQLHKYVSWMSDPNAFHCNAFSLNWSQFTPYLFPPFRLMGRVLNKIMEDQVQQALIVCPFLPNQTWYPLFLDVLVSFPVRIPRHKDLLVLPHSGQTHPLGKNLQMIGAIVSACSSRIRDFWLMLSKQSSVAGDQGHENSTHQPGLDGHAGVISGSVVPFVRLKPTW